MVKLDVIDSIVLVMTLTVYIGIGIYFGRKRQVSREYTSAGGDLGVIPVGLSIAVTSISIITVQVFEPNFYFPPDLTSFEQHGISRIAFIHTIYLNSYLGHAGGGLRVRH